MSKVNIEGFLEVECSILNENAIKLDKLNKLSSSPGLKVQLFLNREDAKTAYEGYEEKSGCTKIICEMITNNGKCNYNNSPCLYEDISTDKR